MFCVGHFKNILEVVTCKLKHYNIHNILQLFYFTCNYGLRHVSLFCCA